MAVQSAGLLVHRHTPEGIEVLIAHPGGPIWGRRDAGAWTIPKGIIDEGESSRQAAAREFTEETGLAVPAGEWLSLGHVLQAGGKIVRGYAVQGDPDLAAFCSNTFTMVWPPRSGQQEEFPEIDRILWATPEVAAEKLNPAQVAFVERLVELLGAAEG